jgi:hypothetical protein
MVLILQWLCVCISRGHYHTYSLGALSMPLSIRGTYWGVWTTYDHTLHLNNGLSLSSWMPSAVCLIRQCGEHALTLSMLMSRLDSIELNDSDVTSGFVFTASTKNIEWIIAKHCNTLPLSLIQIGAKGVHMASISCATFDWLNSVSLLIGARRQLFWIQLWDN